MTTLAMPITGKPVPSGSLGICWLIYGALRLAGAIWLAVFVNTAMLMFGALLNRVANPFSLMSVFHLFYGFVIALSAVTGILGLIAGAALMAGRASGRMVALIAGFLALPDLPLGVILGVYTIIALPPATSARAS